MLSNRYQKGWAKFKKPWYYWIFRLSVIIPTRQAEMQSKLFCIDRLIPFGLIWYQLSQSYGVSDFLLSKSYHGMLSIAEVCNLDYLYHTTPNVSIICHHNLFVYHPPYHAIFLKLFQLAELTGPNKAYKIHYNNQQSALRLIFDFTGNIGWAVP